MKPTGRNRLIRSNSGRVEVSHTATTTTAAAAATATAQLVTGSVS